MKYSSRWILDLVYLKGAHFQGILLDVGDGHIEMCYTATIYVKYVEIEIRIFLLSSGTAGEGC